MDEIRAPFTDLVRMAECELVIPPGGQIYPAAPGQPKIGVAHPGAAGEVCVVLADIAIELDAFYCPLCQWNGRISGAWCLDLLDRVYLAAGGGAGCIICSRLENDAAAIWCGVMLAACAMSSHWYSPPRNVVCWVPGGSPVQPPPA